MCCPGDLVGQVDQLGRFVVVDWDADSDGLLSYHGLASLSLWTHKRDIGLVHQPKVSTCVSMRSAANQAKSTTKTSVLADEQANLPSRSNALVGMVSFDADFLLGLDLAPRVQSIGVTQ